MKDRDLIEMLFVRSEAALAMLQERYGRLASGIAGNILRCEADAEECVSDALCAVWNRIPPEKPDPFLPYFLRIVRNLAIKRRRFALAEKRGGGEDLPLDADVLSELSAFDEAESDAEVIRDTLNGFLEDLTGKERAIFLRRYWFEEPVGVIAAELGLTENHVRVKLTRLKGKLRAYFEKEGITL